MRKELKDFNWHVYGLSLSDYEYTFQIVTEVIRDRQKQLQQKIDTLEVFNGDGNLITAPASAGTRIEVKTLGEFFRSLRLMAMAGGKEAQSQTTR